MNPVNTNIEKANAAFWNELCGSAFARSLGIQDHTVESLRRFDDAYLDFYPYLLKRVKLSEMRGKKVLEVGLGYGTLGQKIAEVAEDYTGLDIARSPVSMMNHRLSMFQLPGKALQASILNCPIQSATQDAVVSIGCFHHTGDAARSIEETYRVLKPGGKAFLMLYNRFSFRQWRNWPLATWRACFRKVSATENQRRAYDINTRSESAPETAFHSIHELKKMFRRFSQVEFHKENCDDLCFLGKRLISRTRLLSTLGVWLGLDIYIEAKK